jgi:hypothetical protein
MEFDTFGDFQLSDNYNFWYNRIHIDYDDLTLETIKNALYYWWNDTKNGIVINPAEHEVPKPITTIQDLEWFGVDLWNEHYCYLLDFLYPYVP